jgi:hypothetical protein
MAVTATAEAAAVTVTAAEAAAVTAGTATAVAAAAAAGAAAEAASELGSAAAAVEAVEVVQAAIGAGRTAFGSGATIDITSIAGRHTTPLLMRWSVARVSIHTRTNDAHIAKLLSEDEARRIASNIAKLPIAKIRASPSDWDRLK